MASTRNWIFSSPSIDTTLHFDGPSSSESKELRFLEIDYLKFRLLEIEANAVIYIHPKFSNERGFWHRQPNTTEISLLRSLVASQQLISRVFSEFAEIVSVAPERRGEFQQLLKTQVISDREDPLQLLAC